MQKKDNKLKLSEENKESILELAEHGLNYKEIEKFLGLDTGVIEQYTKKSVIFKRSLDNAELKLCLDVEKALLRRAVGYETVEEHTSFKADTKKSDNEETGEKLKETKLVKKFVPPDASAALIWLYNRRGERWSKNPDSSNELNNAELSKLRKIALQEAEDNL